MPPPPPSRFQVRPNRARLLVFTEWKQDGKSVSPDEHRFSPPRKKQGPGGAPGGCLSTLRLALSLTLAVPTYDSVLLVSCYATGTDFCQYEFDFTKNCENDSTGHLMEGATTPIISSLLFVFFFTFFCQRF